MSDSFYAVILAGGRGERFWPLSTAKRPKQLLSLVGGRPLLVQAVDRLEGLVPPERIFVITNADLVDVTREAAPALPASHIIGEPFGRDTAAAVALGCALVKERDPNASFCVLTADHIIKDVDAYQQTLRDGLALASREDVLITIGIPPTEPSTGYGYIEAGDLYSEDMDTHFLKTDRFVEKPDAETARRYMAAGGFYWNSGMFIWSVRALEQALEAHRPALAEMMRDVSPAVGTDRFSAALKTAYDKLDKISIDYAVMEKAANIVMAIGSFPWDDVGSWQALENHFDVDEHGNVMIGDARGLDAARNVVVSEGRLTAIIGVTDVVVVQAAGATLVCARERAQDVKKMVEQLRKAGGYDEVL